MASFKTIGACKNYVLTVYTTKMRSILITQMITLF